MNNTPFTFGGFTVPAGCQRIYITAQLESSNGDPRIQPTGFPDVGPVCYPDPNTGADSKGLICLIQSEPAMANLLEEVCLADKYTGELKASLNGLPYIRLTSTGDVKGDFVTASTIDGHRFASEYILEATGKKGSPYSDGLVGFIRNQLDVDKADAKGKRVPAAKVPKIFELVAEHDPLSLIHGFQISHGQLTFVGLRSPRALTACILGYRCQSRPVPGVRLDPIGTGEAAQAIFQKERVVTGEIEAKFSIDVGLLASLQLAAKDSQQSDGRPSETQPQQLSLRGKRFRLLVALALWKVATLLKEFEVERSLRTECKLRLKSVTDVKYVSNAGIPSNVFPLTTISAATSELAALITNASLGKENAPLTLKFTVKKRGENKSSTEASQPTETSDAAQVI